MAKVEAQQEKLDVEYRAQQAEWNNKFNRTLDELRDLRNQHDKRLYKLELSSQNIFSYLNSHSRINIFSNIHTLSKIHSLANIPNF
ncbi:MAG: hypothetical protein IJU79_03245 [Desulfovibrionaceae bacterium]|nr:hypothetical protein [Desulfovibrionaceae bacterium]